ncbi:MAG: exodeoxyribonuclease VII large subunit [candidate division Zixibacteria bacterium]|nr:exodeoxyribonuclease VII large subunit [candidate division Zixibacteria bacterium]
MSAEHVPEKVYSVSEITRDIKSVLESEFGSVWVEGEISNYLHHSSGHRYFTLKDSSAQLKAVIWKFAARGLRLDLKDGLMVRAFGDLTLYEKGGYYQLRINRLQPVGVGSLQQQFEKLKAKLAAAGLFDPERKRPIPRYPAAIGIVTSPTGAAVRDIINICRRRAPMIRLVLRSTRVQGAGAAADIVAAIDDFNRYGQVDLLIVGRGGGSLEDLWAFNEEPVARAIAASAIPIMSAVGHEIDFTIADFTADLRAPTPSTAAELATYDAAAIVSFLEQSQTRLPAALKRIVGEYKQRLSRAIESRVLARPEVLLESSYQCFDELKTRFRGATESYLLYQHNRLEMLAQKLLTLSPDNVLRRGYAIVRTTDDGRIITDAASLTVKDQVEITFAKGRRTARIE